MNGKIIRLVRKKKQFSKLKKGFLDNDLKTQTSHGEFETTRQSQTRVSNFEIDTSQPRKISSLI